MRREHRPAYLKRAVSRVEASYGRHFLAPHFERVGPGSTFEQPWHIKVFGPSVHLGQRVHISANRRQPVRLSVWPAEFGLGEIHVGDYSMINPGVSMNAANRIRIGRNAIFAADVWITDCAFPDPYDRVYAQGAHAPVELGDNVWVGQRAIICKGVTVGDNSIVGAGSVVVRDVPAHCIAAGNPARVVKRLDPGRRFISRDHVFSDLEGYLAALREQERAFTADNSLLRYLRYLTFPRRGD